MLTVPENLPERSFLARFFASAMLSMVLVLTFGGLNAAVPTIQSASDEKNPQAPGEVLELGISLTSEERAWITGHPTVRVHNETNWRPFNFNQDGKPAGFSIDYMNLVASKVGLEVEYVSGPSWNQFLEMMRSGELDVMLNIVRTPERDTYLHFTEPYSETPSVLVVRSGEAAVNVIEDMHGKRVCVPRGFFTQSYLERAHPQIELVLLDDALECLYAVLESRADGALDDYPIMRTLLREHTLIGLRIAHITREPGMESILNIATRSDAPILRDIIQKGMDALGPEEITALRQKWLGEEAPAATPTEPVQGAPGASPGASSEPDGTFGQLLIGASLIFAVIVAVVFVRLWRGQGEKKAILILLILMLLALIGAALYTFSLYVANNEAVAEAKERRLESLRLVDHLRQTSDDLTRMARTYAVTGEQRFEDYFNQILAIRNGEAPRPVGYGEIYWDHVAATGRKPREDGEAIALVALMERAGFAPDELDLLGEAKRRSDRLAALEKKAMNAVKGLFQDRSGSYNLRGEPDLALAREVLHGNEYHRTKAEIMALVERVSRQVDVRTGRDVEDLKHSGAELVQVASLLGLGGLLVVGLLLLLAAIWMRPAQEASERESVIARDSAVFMRRMIGTALVKSWPLFLMAVLVAALIAGLQWRNMLRLERTQLQDLEASHHCVGQHQQGGAHLPPGARGRRANLGTAHGRPAIDRHAQHRRPGSRRAQAGELRAGGAARPSAAGARLRGLPGRSVGRPHHREQLTSSSGQTPARSSGARPGSAQHGGTGLQRCRLAPFLGGRRPADTWKASPADGGGGSGEQGAGSRRQSYPARRSGEAAHRDTSTWAHRHLRGELRLQRRRRADQREPLRRRPAGNRPGGAGRAWHPKYRNPRPRRQHDRGFPPNPGARSAALDPDGCQRHRRG